MFTREYFVVRGRDDWWIRSWDGNFGPYVSREVAKQGAIAKAQKDHRNRLFAKVFIEESLTSALTLVYDTAVDRG